MNTYKSCAVPFCTNTKITTPNKLFIYVPVNKRKKWCELARRVTLPTGGSVYFCEDHFDLPNVIENYLEYQLSGNVKRLIKKPGCIPTKFHCQPGRKRSSPIRERSAVTKRRKIATAEAAIERIEALTREPTPPPEMPLKVLMEEPDPPFADKGVQVNFRPKIRSKRTQTNFGVSPPKFGFASCSTTPYVPEPGFKQPQKVATRTMQSESESNTSTEGKDSCSQTSSEEQSLQQQTVALSLAKFKKNPMLYLGIPETCIEVIQILCENLKFREEDLFVCLLKIRLNRSFEEIGDDFGTTTSNVTKIFSKFIPKIRSHLAPILINLNFTAIRRNLPTPFHQKYRDVSCIIDCFEIEVEKPSKGSHQKATWSQGMKCHTVKYLISSTPDGVINYVSPGYAGRASDTFILQDCNFVRTLPAGTFILADRGFKQVENFLTANGHQLVRLPGLPAKKKMSDEEKAETERIVSLRMHIERIVSRVREFALLKPHSMIDKALLAHLDDCVVIGCGLTNLQDTCK